ncbi:hypothetical protein [Variovorax sp. ZT5R36]|uniref:hypothetical protein n=2 Tax=unclassified Variovorax TaxID=663243 RepID=UPI003F495D71
MKMDQSQMRSAIHRLVLMFALGCMALGGVAFFWAWWFPWFAPDQYLMALAWKYSALLSIPTAILILSTARDRTKGKPGVWIFFSLTLYVMFGVAVLWTPRIAVNFADFPRASSVATVDAIFSGSRTCGAKVRISMAEYSVLSGFVLCVPAEFARTLVRGDKLRLEGRAGLHGLSVDNYVKQ